MIKFVVTNAGSYYLLQIDAENYRSGIFNTRKKMTIFTSGNFFPAGGKREKQRETAGVNSG
jgi:hypothetical protein